MDYRIFYRTKGKDNIITDGYKFAPYVEMPQGYGSKIEFEGPRSDFWAYGFDVYSGKGSEYSPSLNKSYGYKGFVRFFPMENLVFSLGYANHKEKEWLNNYHKIVFKEIAPSLNIDQRSWLEVSCSPIH